MASCLGLYIENNLIKYAKVSKEKDGFRMDSYGIKFYSNINEAIEQIVQETNSMKTPISVNIVDESYQYFSMFSQLNKKDLEKAIRMEFEAYCTEKGYNANTLETRYLCADDTTNLERIKVINISENTVELNKIKQLLNGKKIGMMLPVPITITNVAELSGKENVLIVNLEEKTTITTINRTYISDIQILDEGSGIILQNIEKKENSYAKAYEALRNTTIYTSDAIENMESDGEQAKYLEDILPVLYTIIGAVQAKSSEGLEKIDRIYLTGTLACINNLDLYFQEYLGGTKCEILKPFFIEDSPKVNMKDYIEVNSAISLALQGLEYGLANMNFNKKNTWKQIKEALFSDITFGGKKGKDNGKKKININLNSPKVKQWVMRDFFGVLVLLVVYGGLATYIDYGIKEKEKEISDTKTDINAQITLIDRDREKINSKTSEYTTLTTNLQNASDAANTKNAYKNVITTFLSEIMYVIPKEVVLTSIENPSARKIVINAQSEKYEQLAYFKALLKSKGVLTPSSVVSSEATKEGNIVKIVIEGELP